MSRLPLLTLLVIVTACASRRDAEAAPGEPQTIVVQTTNDNFYDARVHAVFRGGQRHSLGTIAGNGGRSETTVAWEPHALVFEISFIVGGESYLSIPRDVVRGEAVELRLPANISESGFFRRVSSGR